MASTQKTTKKKGPEVFYPEAPSDRSLNNLASMKNSLQGSPVFITEELDGLLISLTFNPKDGKVYVRREEDGFEDVSTDLLIDYTTAQSRTVYDFVSEFGLLETTLYGFYIGKNKHIKYSIDSDIPFVFSDAYVNRNWICWDDFSSIAKKAGLTIVPEHKQVKFEEELKVDEVNSLMTVGHGVKGLLYRTLMEGMEKGKRFASLQLSSQFVPKLPEPTKKDPLIEKYADAIIQESTDNYNLLKWKYLLQEKGIKLEKKNLGDIMKTIVPECLATMKEDIEFGAKGESFSEEDIKKAIRKKLPRIIRKKLDV